MGGGTFGIAAAADFYFGKPVKDLNLAEAAMLAGLFKAPAKYAPHVNLPAARARANVVLTNLVQSGFMTEGQVLQARLHPADVVDRGEAKSPDYFLDFAFEEAKKLAAKSGIHSMVARTTIDHEPAAGGRGIAASSTCASTARNMASPKAPSSSSTPTARCAPSSAGCDYGTSQFNRATRALRQTGSSFKPYVYATAMENGFTPDSIISDGPITWGGWSPKNYGRSFSGRMTLATALIKSVNTVPVRLAKEHLSMPPDHRDGQGHGRRVGHRAVQDLRARHVGHDGDGPGHRLQRLRQWRLLRHPPCDHADPVAIRARSSSTTTAMRQSRTACFPSRRSPR